MNKLLPILLFLSFAAAAVEPETLWYQVDSGAKVWTLNAGPQALGAIKDKDGNGLNAARVRVTGDGVDNDVFLYHMVEQDNGSWMTVEGATINELGVYNSSGAVVDQFATGWTPLNLGAYSGAAYSFVLELGFADESGWMSTLASATRSYEDFVSAGNLSTGGVTTQGQTPWTPDMFASIPEPSSGLLLLLGGTLLALRRRRLA